MLSVLSLALVAPISLRLTVPRMVAPGEEAVFEAAVKNMSKAPVTLVVAELPNMNLGMSLGSEITGPNGPVYTDSNNPMFGQWFTGGGPTTARPFFTLEPGESRKLYWEKFTRVFAEGPSSGLIDERAKALRADLAPCFYTWRVSYTLTKNVSKPERRGAFSRKGTTFTKEGQKAFDASWKGEASAEARFEVRAKV